MSGAEAFDLYAFRAAYTRFLKPGRILLTGHSHQAWPDVVLEALTRSFDDSAAYVDDKWERVVFPKLETVGAAVLARMGFDPGDAIAFGKSTHELVFRLLSCLSLGDKPRIVTTTSEFHSLHRQLARLAEAGADVVWVDAQPRERLAERLLGALTPETKMLALSAVLFEDAYIVPSLDAITARAAELGAIVLVDAYHAFNVVPIAWGPAKQQLFVTAGGYKYAGFGEGICWLRIPPDCALRPLDTGWFADFRALERERTTEIAYGPRGARFAGATFDPVAVYRAEAVIAHWNRFGLSLERLREISLRQTRRIVARVDDRGFGDRLVSPREDARRGGFVTLRTNRPTEVVARLREQKIYIDARGGTVRLGPAPYLEEAELDFGTEAVLREL